MKVGAPKVQPHLPHQQQPQGQQLHATIAMEAVFAATIPGRPGLASCWAGAATADCAIVANLVEHTNLRPCRCFSKESLNSSFCGTSSRELEQ